MKRLASAAVAYYGIMGVVYLMKEARGGRVVRSLAAAATAYYAIMGIISLKEKVYSTQNADAG
jgi:hypothetical protein